MKTKIFLPVFLMILLIPFASASFFDWLTGKASEETAETPTIEQPVEISSEQITCIFIDSSSMQSCYSNEFKCSGIGSCPVAVSGAKGTQLTWKSTCGGYAYTAIDGTDEKAEFTCPRLVEAQPTPTTQTTTTTAAETLKEQVKCIFTNSASEQKCYTADGRFGCSGMGSCIADVASAKGTQLPWKSSCGGYASTTVDGINEYAEFRCEQLSVQTPTQTTAVVEAAKEEVKCIFSNSNSMQSCYSDKSSGCNGVGSCSAAVYGGKGERVTWKSSCGGYAYTVMDGNNEYAEFGCVPAETIQPTTASTQVAVPKPPTTVQQATTTVPVTTTIANKAPVYVFKNDACPHCESERIFLEQLKQKYPQVEIKYYESSPPGGSVATYGMVVVNYLEKGIPATFINDKVWNGYSDAIAAEIEKEVRYCIASGCGNPKPPIPSEMKVYASSFTTRAPATQISREQVRCLFYNSDTLINPHTAKHEKCYSDYGFGCEWTGNVEEKQLGGGKTERFSYCVAEVNGNTGTKLTWKSTCGGYAYTVTDGNNEEAAFTCVPSEQVTTEQITGKGFRNAYWQCYDKAEQKQVVSSSVACKSADVWKMEAENFCKGHCYDDGSKCGVNSFSISGECYLEAGKEGVVVFPAVEEKIPVKETVRAEAAEKTEKIAVKEYAEATVEEKKEEILICKDSCPLEGKCYPFGYRKTGRYCSDEGTFKPQFKGEAACDNNFECLSNVCVDSRCVSQATIQRIMGWFRKLFS